MKHPRADAWNVPTHIPAGSAPSDVRSRLTRALFVNVTARMLATDAFDDQSRDAEHARSADPAPASTSNGPLTCNTASRCAGFSPAVNFSSSINVDTCPDASVSERNVILMRA
jgi:hypothetical protein